MSELLKINVNQHVEKKNGLTYLSWAWAWAEVLKIDPQARWEAHEWNGLPAMFLPDGSAMVKVSVTLKDDAKTCVLPVMDHRNKAIKNPDAFAINTATMRCLAKAISMHGLGLYIYAGEDLPEADTTQADAEAAKREEREAELRELALFLVDCHQHEKDGDAIRVWYDAKTWSEDVADKAEEQKYVWGLLKNESKLRSTIKANHPDRLAAKAKEEATA
jgi:hypothetical protein